MHRQEDTGNEYTQMLLRAQAGDTQAFAELYSLMSPAVRDYLVSLNGGLHPYDCDDLVQEVFLRTWQGSASYRGAASAKTFLFAIAKNVLVKHVCASRKLPRIRTGDLHHVPDRDAIAEPAGSAQSDSGELATIIRLAMAQLTESQRQAVELDQLPDLSRQMAAKLANCTPSQFADRLYQARKRLRQLLKAFLDPASP